VPESSAQTDLFLYEPELVSHIAELIHSESSIPYEIQTAAISALDAMARYRHRLAEVISAINASANHGVLMSLFRSMVVKLAEDQPEPPFEFVEALITFITFLIATAAYSNMLIGAGLVPLLVQLVQNQLPSRLPIVVKSINLLDHVVYSNPNGFTIFRNAGGLEALTDRIQSTVDHGIETHGSQMETDASDETQTYGILPFPRYSALKALLRSISRMMQTTGTADGLRNLIDSSLPKSVKKIIEYRKVFGATVFSHGQ
jgi:E3 ubiquitin-protein ligase HUWE1